MDARAQLDKRCLEGQQVRELSLPIPVSLSLAPMNGDSGALLVILKAKLMILKASQAKLQ